MSLAAAQLIPPYVKDEVRRQGYSPGTKDYELRVVWMLAAWAYAKSHEKERITLIHVLEVGRLCEQERNATGTRRVGVAVGGNRKMDWRLGEGALENLLSHQDRLDPDIFYFEYETIHPFVDGNGRSGKILLNWRNGTLDDPIMPPNFWGGSNP